MKEVSCRVLDLFFLQAQAQGVPLEALAQGVPYSLAALRDKHGRIEWDHLVRFMQNVGSIWTPDELVQIGIGVFASRYAKPWAAVGKLLFSAPDLYRWVFERSLGPGNQAFTCIDPSFTQVDATRLLLQLQIRPGYRTCPEFFIVSKGNFAGMTQILGLPLAQVDMEMTDRCARYHVVLPLGGGWLRQLRRFVTLPFDARSAAAELKEARATLHSNYGHLEAMKQGLAQRTEELETLNLIGRSLVAHTDLEPLSDAVVRLLQERFGFSGAAIWLAGENGFTLLKEFGADPQSAPQTFPLVQAGSVVGRLEVWGPNANQHTGGKSLKSLPLDEALPWIAMALANLRAAREAWRGFGTPGASLAGTHSRGAPVIADYALLKLIGRGAYGEVWLARNVVGIYRAVKVLYRSKFEVPEPYEREFKAVERFMQISHGHPGFVSIFHVGREEAAGYFYYVMDIGDDESAGQKIEVPSYCPRSLSRDLNRRGRLPVEACLDLGILLADGLQHLHDQGLVHRDIKPSNVIFLDGVPRFADIGLITYMAGESEQLSRVGTPDYMAPEGPGRATADVYSLGKLLYVAGMGKNVSEFPDLPTAIVSPDEGHGLSQLNDIILQATATSVQARFQSAACLARALRGLRARISSPEATRTPKGTLDPNTSP